MYFDYFYKGKNNLSIFIARGITKNGRVIAIDGGKCGDADEFKRLVTENGGEIDLWLITHPHRDHYETLIELSQRKDSSIKVGKDAEVGYGRGA